MDTELLNTVYLFIRSCAYQRHMLAPQKDFDLLNDLFLTLGFAR